MAAAAFTGLCERFARGRGAGAAAGVIAAGLVDAGAAVGAEEFAVEIADDFTDEGVAAELEGGTAGGAGVVSTALGEDIVFSCGYLL